LVLYFDTYIVSRFSNINGGLHNIDDERKKCLDFVRLNETAYKYCAKIDIVKYTLISYSEIKWESVIIRFECEDFIDNYDFLNFCKKLFPQDQIQKISSILL